MCFSIVKGRCWLVFDGRSEPILLEEGDCVVLPNGRAFGLASDPDIPQSDFKMGLTHALPGGVSTVNGGGEFLLAGTRFVVEARHIDLLRGTLPEIVHLREKADQAMLRWSVDRMMEEMKNEQPGNFLLTQQLAHMILLLAMRRHLAEVTPNETGWFVALADKHIGVAITAMHADLKFRWTLDELAKRANMSRSRFAKRFKAVAGETPIEYLTRWRILVAADELRTSGDPIAKIAAEVGYQSESAFSNAFKRLVGTSPRRYVNRLESNASGEGKAGDSVTLRHPLSDLNKGMMTQ